MLCKGTPPHFDGLLLPLPQANFLHFPACSTDDVVSSWPAALLDVSKGSAGVCGWPKLQCAASLPRFLFCKVQVVARHVLASVLKKTIPWLLNPSEPLTISCPCVKYLHVTHRNCKWISVRALHVFVTVRKHYASPYVAGMLQLKAEFFFSDTFRPFSFCVCLYLYLCMSVCLCRECVCVCVCVVPFHILQEVWLILLDNDTHVLAS